MATYARKRKPTARIAVEMDGEMFEVELCKLNLTEILTVERSGRKIHEGIKAQGDALTPEAHAELVELVCGLVHEVHGLNDEDGAPLAWAALSEDERHDLFASIAVDSLIELFKRAGEVGRLSAEEKKA